MISRPQASATVTDGRALTPLADGADASSEPAQPSPAAASCDPVEAALAAGIAAIAGSMARAPAQALAALADRMAVLTRELEARRSVGAAVVDLASRRSKR